MGNLLSAQQLWIAQQLSHENILVRRAAAESLGESGIQNTGVTLEVLEQFDRWGFGKSGWQLSDLERLAFDARTLERCLRMVQTFHRDRHQLAVELILLHPPELLLPIESELLRLPDLTRIEFELLRESINFYRASSGTLWEKLGTMATALTKYPKFPRRIKESVKALAREVARRPYPQNSVLENILRDVQNDVWLRGLACLILGVRNCRDAGPLLIETLMASTHAELSEFAEDALVSLQDEAVMEQIIREFPLQSHDYRVVMSSLFYRLPFSLTLKNAFHLAEGQGDEIAYGLMMSYNRAFDRLGIERNYAIARSKPSSSEMAFLGVESIGFALATGIELPDLAFWMAEAKEVGLLNESVSIDEFVAVDFLQKGTQYSDLMH